MLNTNSNKQTVKSRLLAGLNSNFNRRSVESRVPAPTCRWSRFYQAFLSGNNSKKPAPISRWYSTQLANTILFVFTLLITQSSFLATAQTPSVKEWDKRFGGSHDDYLFSLQKTADEGYILGGKSSSGISGDKTQASQGSSDYWIVKTDANGVKQWDARFGGGSTDHLYSLQQTADGGYILGGYSYSGKSGDKTQKSQGSWDYWIVKTDANGVKQWDARFGGSGIDYLYSLQQTADGGYILGGYSSSGISGDKTQASQGSYDYWIVKTDANGAKQWDARFGGGSYDYLFSLQQTADGGYILGGYSYSGISGDKTQSSWGQSDCWIVKTDANGTKQWDARFGGSSYDDLQSLHQTADGGYILGGSSQSGISGDKTQASQGLNDYWIVKTDANGVKQWDARFGGSDYDFLGSLQQTDDGGYILGGGSYSGISGDKTQASQGDGDSWIVKTNGNGTKQWDARFGGSFYDGVSSLQQTAEGGYILGGTSYSGISGDKTQASQGLNDYWIVKVTGDSFVCAIPANLSVTNITSTSAQLNWDAVPGAASYKIRYRVAGTSQWTTKNSNGNSINLTNLSPDTKYTWQAKTLCTNTPGSDWSAKKNFTTAPLRLSDAPEQQTSFQIYPNPAEDHATIQFTLAQSSHVCIKVYDVSGKEIESLLNEEMEIGEHSLVINTNQFSKGVYMVRMISDFGIVRGTPYGENQKLIVQ